MESQAFSAQHPPASMRRQKRNCISTRHCTPNLCDTTYGRQTLDTVREHETAEEDISNCQGLLSYQLNFLNKDLETAYLLAQAESALTFDKAFVLVRFVFTLLVAIKVGTQKFLGPLAIAFCEQTLQAVLLWTCATFHLQHRVLLTSAFKSVHLVLVPFLPSAFRADSASWWGALQLVLTQSDVGGGLLNLYCFSSTFRADVLTQLAQVVTVVYVTVQMSQAEGGLCDPVLEGFLGKVHAAMQQASEHIVSTVVGGTANVGSSYRDPCLVVAVFSQIFLSWVLPMVISWGVEREHRIRWWQRHTRRTVPPGAGLWCIPPLQLAAIVLLNGVTLFMAVNAAMHFLP